MAVSLGVLVEEGDPQLAGAAVHVVPHELVGVAGPGLLPDLPHHRVPDDPVDPVVKVPPQPVRWGSVVPVLDPDVGDESVGDPHPPLVDLPHLVEVNVRVGLLLPSLEKSIRSREGQKIFDYIDIGPHGEVLVRLAGLVVLSPATEQTTVYDCSLQVLLNSVHSLILLSVSDLSPVSSV